jgi:hypothetical protein
MLSQLTDTNPEAEKILIEIRRNMSVSKKLMQVFSFSSEIIKLSKRAISRANPHLTEDEKKILFIRLHYGDDLADKFQSFLAQRPYGKK